MQNYIIKMRMLHHQESWLHQNVIRSWISAGIHLICLLWAQKCNSVMSVCFEAIFSIKEWIFVYSMEI